MKPKSFRIIRFYFKHSQSIVIAAVVTGLLAGAISAALMAMISIKISQPGDSSSRFVWAFVGLALLDLGAGLFAGLLSNALSQRTSFDLRMRLCRQILAAPLRRLEETGTHRIGSVLSQDIQAITDAFLSLPQICVHLAVVLGSLAYLSYLSPLLVGALVLILIVAVISIKLPESKGRRYMRRAREEWDALTGHWHALVDGAKELKLHHGRRQAFLTGVIQESTTALRQNSLASGRFYAVLNSWSQMLFFFILGLILFTLPYLNGGNHRVVTIFAETFLFIRGHIIALMSVLPIFNRANVSMQKVEDLGISLSAFGNQEAPALQDKITQWRSIELSSVTHTYEREHEEGSFTLGPLNLTLEPGELIFIVGGNGSGKTTLSKVLTGLYPPEAGEILLDGKPVTDENRDQYRQYFSAVFSEFYLFEQLLGLDDYDLDENAGRYLSELRLENKVTVKDGRLSTVKLSFGQRKRLALLTAYLEDRPIYLFDEWASGQDPTFKAFFYEQILPALKARGKTVVVISHDDRFFHLADRVVKLDEGSIQQVGTVGALHDGNGIAPLVLEPALSTELK